MIYICSHIKYQGLNVLSYNEKALDLSYYMFCHKYYMNVAFWSVQHFCDDLAMMVGQTACCNDHIATENNNK